MSLYSQQQSYQQQQQYNDEVILGPQQLSDIILTVNSLIETLEYEEEQQEIEFFATEKQKIQTDFDRQLADFQQTLINISSLSLTPQPVLIQPYTLPPPVFSPYTQSLLNIQTNYQATVGMLAQLQAVVDSVQSVSNTNNVTGEVTLVCTGDQELHCSHQDLHSSLVHDNATQRYVCPAVSADTMSTVLQCLRQGVQCCTEINDNIIPLVLQASNILQIPWLFIICCSRIFTQRANDLAFLHQLVIESFLSKVSVQCIVDVQEELKNVHVQYKESIAATLNMYWYHQSVHSYASLYKQHVKQRSKLLKSTVKTKTVQWLNVYIELRVQTHLHSLPPSHQHVTVTQEEQSVWQLLGRYVEVLDCTGVTTGVPNIHTAIRHAPNLSVLKLDSVGVDEQSVLLLCRGVTKLSTLSLVSCGFTPHQFHMLQSKLPHVTIVSVAPPARKSRQ